MAFARGQWRHHNDCTWCVHHQDVPLEIKRGKVIRCREICQRTQQPLPPPYDVRRFCESYRQVNCGCAKCSNLATIVSNN